MGIPLRIGVDARLVEGIAGGVAQVILGLASGLSQLTDGDEEYQFLVYADAGEWIKPYLQGPCRILQGNKVSRPPGWKTALKSALPGVADAWQKLSPLAGRRAVKLPRSDGTIERAGLDVMHFTLQTAFLTDVPSIYHPHDLQHVHLPQFFTPRARQVRDAEYQAFCEQARMVAVMASWGKSDLMRHFGLSDEKVQVVHWAPAVLSYPNPGSADLLAVQQKFSLPSAFIFYPANTWEHKNHMGLLAALAILRDRHGLIVPLVSSGHRSDFYPTIEQRARELQLSDQVQFLGFVSPLELQCLYRLCRCVVVPTRFEAASGPLWEAFVAGVPAACSNVTSLPAQAGDAALVFDPEDPEAIADAIYRLWTDDALCSLLVARGKENVSRFTWDRTARTFRAHYRRIANRALTDEDRALLAAPPLI